MGTSGKVLALIVALVFILGIGLMVYGAILKKQTYKTWMAECSKHEPEYRCEILWREAE